MTSTTKRIAKQRVQKLFCLAMQSFNKDPLLAQRYIDIVRKIAMASNISIQKEHKYKICRYCKSFILPGRSCHVRIKQRREPHIVITCTNCKKHLRIPLKEKTIKNR
jgi:ribonuclease P protein subunit RPR2